MSFLSKREIKFRAWNGSRYMDNEEFVIDNGQVMTMSNGECDGYLPDAILEQFTGLKDKNGKEIYEGDILELTHMLGAEFGRCGFLFVENRFVVEYNAPMFIPRPIENRFYEDEGENSGWCRFCVERLFEQCPNSGFSIIGNIHENPELLGGEL